MPTATLTVRDVKKLRFDPAGPAKQVLWDAEIPGFGCRVYPSGRKAWVVKYRATRGRAGTQRLLVLKGDGVLTLDEARKRAKAMLVRVLDGEDPAVERERERRASTVAELAAACRWRSKTARIR